MIKKIEGIVLSETSYKETSKIIQVLTKEYGIVSFLAKGAKGMKSNLRNATTKITYGHFISNFRKDTLSVLTGVDILNSFKEIKKDIVKISYASFLLDLTSQVVKNTFDAEIFTHLIASLNKIEEGYDALAIANILELKYLYYLGVLPNLDGCSLCGAKENIVTLSGSCGGYLCKNCLTNEPKVSTKAMKLVRMYYYVDIAKIEKLKVSDTIKEEINAFLDAYYDKYTGLYLKTKAFLKNLNKIEMK